MSEVRERFTLEEYVFTDIWEAHEFRIVKNKLLKKKAGITPIDLIDEYQKLNLERDAERWEYAWESYEHYPYFDGNTNYNRNNKGKDKDKEYYLFYRCTGVCQCYFKITADVLTGPNAVIKIQPQKGKREMVDLSKSKNEELKSALELFCSVAYTVGNFCPVMKNPGGDSDTCWYKLSNYLSREEFSKKESTDIEDVFCKNLTRKGVNNDQVTRYPKDMFIMFHGNPSRKEIIERLMLQDYYKDSDYEDLAITKTPLDYWNDGEDAYIKFLNMITKLIIKRGIRIYCQNDLSGINIDEMTDKLFDNRMKQLKYIYV